MRTFDNFLLSITTLAGSCAFPLLAQLDCKLQKIPQNHVNPRSASTWSLGNKKSNILEFSVINLSDALPPYTFDKKNTVPCSVMPIKNFIVLWLF